MTSGGCLSIAAAAFAALEASSSSTSTASKVVRSNGPKARVVVHQQDSHPVLSLDSP